MKEHELIISQIKGVRYHFINEGVSQYEVERVLKNLEKIVDNIFIDLEDKNKLKNEFTKSDMIVGKHAFKTAVGTINSWNCYCDDCFSEDLKSTIKINGKVDNMNDIIEIYELLKLSEINQPEINQ